MGHAKAWLQRYRGASLETVAGWVKRIRMLARYLSEEHGLREKEEIQERIRPPPPAQALTPLTPAQIDAMIKAAGKMKTKALIAVLNRGRPKDRGSPQAPIRNVTFDEKGAKIMVENSKTQPRPVRIIKYADVLKTWIQNHPQHGDPNAWLFPKPLNPTNP